MTTTTTKAKPVPLPERELWRAPELAAMLGISRTVVYELKRADELPAPVKIGASVAWRSAEIRDWLAAGCPPRVRWTWRRTLPQKLDDLIRDMIRQKESLEKELEAQRRELRMNEQVLLEADQR